MPGDDFADSMQIVLGEVGDLPHVAELPARGPHANMVGRTLAMVSELGVDLQPAGWRLTDGSGLDHRRARSLLAQDLDTVEELTRGHQGDFKIQLSGPWTLAALVERPRGDKVLGDYGARRDLAQALAEGVRDHVADVHRRIAGARLVVQIDEPMLASVLLGSVPTASGFQRHRSVAPADAAQALDWVFAAAGAPDAEAVLHCCAGGFPWSLARQTQARAASFDLSLVPESEYDEVGAWVDDGREVWPGVVPTVEPDPALGENHVTRGVLAWWSRLGFSDAEHLPSTTITPACGLAGASPGWARAALTLAARVARNLSEEQGTMGS